MKHSFAGRDNANISAKYELFIQERKTISLKHTNLAKVFFFYSAF